MKALAWVGALALVVGCAGDDEKTTSPPRTNRAPTLATVMRGSELAFRQAGTRWVSVGDTFDIEVGSNGFTIESLTGARLVLATSSRQSRGSTPVVMRDGSIEIDQGDARERLRNEGRGVEQSWLVGTKPKGEFVVKVGVGESAVAKESRSGLHFPGFRYDSRRVAPPLVARALATPCRGMTLRASRQPHAADGTERRTDDLFGVERNLCAHRERLRP